MRTITRNNRLTQILQTDYPFITIDNTAQVLDISRQAAAMQLQRWQTQGLLHRVRRGVYAREPIPALTSRHPIEEQWKLVPAFFEPAYIGGWTAARHWAAAPPCPELCILTPRQLQRKRHILYGIPVVAKQIQESAFFGTLMQDCDGVEVQISDPHKTIVDILDDLHLGGGFSQVMTHVRDYCASEIYDEELLLTYAQRMGNGAIIKRLGFIAEFVCVQDSLARACANQLTRGKATLHPTVPNTQLIKKWRLLVPEDWQHLVTSDGV